MLCCESIKETAGCSPVDATEQGSGLKHFVPNNNFAMESFLRHIPVRINPVFSMGVVLVLAYIPHLFKKALLTKKLKEAGKQYTTANSRGLSALMIDDSPLGMKIANIQGCHQNGLEAFAYYSAAMLACIVCKVDSVALSGAATLFIVIRCLYTYIYMGPLNGSPRTYLFFTSAFFCLGLFIMAGLKYSHDNK
jgi:uncharacterized MAPEG superfamily protein